MSEDPRLTELDITVVTITQDQEGIVSLDSDVDAGETLLLLERVKLMLIVPEFFEEPEEDDDETAED